MKKNTKKPVKSAYAAAGVDIDEMDRGLKSIKKAVSGTRTPGVLSEIGSFGGLFRSPGRGQVLVASTDGVGTKLKVASLIDVAAWIMPSRRPASSAGIRIGAAASARIQRACCATPMK